MFQYALKLVIRRKLRTFLTSLGITIAVILLSFIIFGMNDLTNLLINQFTQMFKPNQIIATNVEYMSFAPLAQDAQDESKFKEKNILNDDLIRDILKNRKDIYSAEIVLNVLGMQAVFPRDQKKLEPVSISGWDINSSDTYFSDFVGKEDREDDEVWIDKKAIKSLGFDNPQEVLNKEVIIKPSLNSMFSLGAKSKSSLGKEYKYRIVGVVTISQDRNDIIMTKNSALRIMADIGGFSSVDEYIKTVGYDTVIFSVDQEKVEEIADWLEKEYSLNTLTSQDFINFLGNITKGLTLALILFGIVSAVVASIGIVNTMIMSIYEQTREIGIIKAIGASNKQVMIIFLIQSGLIGLFGGLMGLVIVFMAMEILDPKIVRILQDSGFSLNSFFHFDLVVALLITGGSFLIGILAGIYPAMKASNLDPIKALRWE